MSKKKQDNLLEAVISNAAQKYKVNLIETIDDLHSKDRPSYSTGSISLDYIISAPKGGLEAGRVIEIWGPNSTGKTTLALSLAANVIKNTDKAAIHIDAEKALNASMLSNMGITERFYSMTTGGAREQANAVVKMVETGEVGIVIVDSLPTWTPLPEGKKSDDDPDVTKPKMGEKANFLGNAIHRLADVCYETNCILVLLNQVRANLGYGGGIMKYPVHSIDHHVSVVLKLIGTAKSTDRRILDSKNNVIGQRVTVTSEKNRLDVPMKTIEIPLILGYGVNPFMEIADLAVGAGVIERKGAWYCIGDNKVQGADKVYQYLYDNREEFQQIKAATIEKLKINYSKTKEIYNPLMVKDVEFK